MICSRGHGEEVNLLSLAWLLFIWYSLVVRQMME